MHLLRLRLHNFRSYPQLTLLPPRGLTVFVGENGAGKTNLLEAVHLCCLGKSHRTNGDQDMIRIGEDTCAVHAQVQRQGRVDEVGVRLYQQQKQRKLIYVDGKVVGRIGELMGHMTCVMFSPEDIEIVRGAPLLRRRFLDMLLSQCQPAYFYSLQHYNAVLKQRNALLRQIAREGQGRDQLPDWDAQLSLAAAAILRARQQASARLSELAQEHYQNISGRTSESLSISYRSTLAESQEIPEDMLRVLKNSREEDIRRQTTGTGPHRDDLMLTMNGQELKSYASQGQLRTAVLALRLSEIDILTKAHGEAPILLLDDVFSELDLGRRGRLIEGLQHVQTFITCTDIADVQPLTPACVLRVHQGEITQLKA